ncbi:MAG: Gfo/Idh/MocA family oxidoreductase [Candidatus Sungbacteria bacterium]|nr:Gfo/Idh/MocA family oxidoreductase [Candidatus Sungbacteria bacterium]
MKAAIVGAGRVSGEHVKAYLACGVEVVAMCGRTKESANVKIQELGISAVAYDDFELMLDTEGPDVVSVCSPPELHCEHTVKIARRGIHVAIEKPVALNKRELFEMHHAVAQYGVRTIIGFVLRWNDLMLNIKQHYLRKIDTLFYLETDYWHGPSHEKEHIPHEYGTRLQQIGAFLGGGCHAVDMARFFTDSDIIEVTAITPTKQEQSIQRTTAAVVRFENGVIGKISATDEVFMPYVFNVALFGGDGSIRLNQFYSRHSHSKTIETIAGIVPDSGAVWHHPFRGMVQELIDCIIQNKETSCSLRSAVNTHLVCFAAEESARRGGVKICLI